MQADTFYSIHAGNIIEILVVLLAYLGYRRESRKDATEREAVRIKQAELHRENTLKLESLIRFNEEQSKINRQRDTQINLLSIQTAQLTSIAQGLDRRIVIIEDKHNREK